MLPTTERDAPVPILVPPHLTGLILGAAGSRARYVHAPRPPTTHDRTSDVQPSLHAGPGRRVPTASGRTPSNSSNSSSSNGGRGSSGWLRSSSPINISWKAGLGGIGMGIGAGGLVSTSCALCALLLNDGASVSNMLFAAGRVSNTDSWGCCWSLRTVNVHCWACFLLSSWSRLSIAWHPTATVADVNRPPYPTH